MSIQIVRVFVSLRQMAVDYAELEQKITYMEQSYDHRFEIVFQSIRQLMKDLESKSEPFILNPNRKNIGIFPEKKNERSDD